MAGVVNGALVNCACVAHYKLERTGFLSRPTVSELDRGAGRYIGTDVYFRHAAKRSDRYIVLAWPGRADSPRDGCTATDRARAQRVGARARRAPRTDGRAALRAPPDRRGARTFDRRARGPHPRRTEHGVRGRVAARGTGPGRAARESHRCAPDAAGAHGARPGRGAGHGADGAGTARRRPHHTRRHRARRARARARTLARGCRAHRAGGEDGIRGRPRSLAAGELTMSDERALAESAANQGALPIAPSMQPALEAAGLRDDVSVRAPRDYEPVDRRTTILSALAVALAVAAALAAQVLTRLIGLVTNLAYHGRFVAELSSPAGTHRPAAVLVLIPIAGALVVGAMARYGSAAIRGHGIPEVMERVLFGESRIPARVLFLKPLSAAIAIGTGGPFGAEGPIIATGGALGSLSGQFLHTTADERKVLLAAGAAAGMAAIFGTPVSAVILAVELLLFEFRPRSLIPVALASATAAGIRLVLVG